MNSNQKDSFIRLSYAAGSTKIEGSPFGFRGYRHGDGGVFVQWRMLGDQLIVENCHTGFVPCFWYADEKQILVSTSIEPIRQYLQPALDYDALGVFLRLGFFLGNKTPFSKVEVLGPSTVMTWRAGQLSKAIAEPQAERYVGTYQAAVHQYVKLFRRSMERICAEITEAPVILLSGGRDSRHIAIELKRLNIKPKFALTAHQSPFRPDVDYPVAAELCDSFGWEHKIVDQPNDLFSLDRWQVRASNLMSHEHGWTKVLVNALDGHAFAFDGVAGDVLSAGLYQENCQNTPRHIVEKWQWNGLKAFTSFALCKELRQAVSSSEELIAEELLHHRGATNPLKSFYFWNRTRRSTALLPFRLVEGTTCFAPYVDRDLMSFLMSLPHIYTADKMFHDRAIEVADKKAASIAYAPAIGGSKRMPWLVPRLYAIQFLLLAIRPKLRLWRTSAPILSCFKAWIVGWRALGGWNTRLLLYLDNLL